MRSLHIALTLFVFFMTAATDNTAEAGDPENTLFLELKTGRVVIELRPDLAPNHVERIKELSREGFYDGLLFHRVIEGFMAQTGDPEGTGMGGSGQNLMAEFTAEPHTRGTLSMARSSSPNSADSQFFIVLDDAPHLNGQYTVWGKVIEGMEHVDQIKLGSSAMNGKVYGPDSIVSMRVAADVEE
ncbi:MAG: peptidylprolyl isomerase [Rhodospirillales bacterium]|nr:peptidylprolyl isomerase [Rhodospirillales bacterium]MBT5520420.1 peptidylprolyl isomerase [Rhodospirillales bacterium]MBT7777366.1 peptidylprolyl isomerase [Rhodospirillales bacterium]